MALYQTSKQITKFTISGIIAVFFDFAVYYGLSNLFGHADGDFVGGMHWNDAYKGLGFISGTFVTYNLNKFWTWRQSDRNSKRLYNFLALYFISFVVNVLINKWGLMQFGDHEIAVQWRIFESVSQYKETTIAAFKTDKLMAFVLATAVSSIVNFIGQKIWVFKEKTTDTDDLI